MIEEFATQEGRTSFGRSNAPRLSDKKKTIALADKRISVCECNWGIFPGQDYIWTRRGLVHQKCENERLMNEAKDTSSALSE